MNLPFDFALEDQRGAMLRQNLTPAEPDTEDILCGSGRVVAEHQGNVRFQRLVAQRYNDYVETDSKKLKTRVTTETLREVLSTGGRFLKKHPIYDLWYICLKQEKVGRDKISHLLRQMARRSGDLPTPQGQIQEDPIKYGQEHQRTVQMGPEGHREGKHDQSGP